LRRHARHGLRETAAPVAFDAGILQFNAKSAITIRRRKEYLE
jgi:hypothetical protein